MREKAGSGLGGTGRDSEGRKQLLGAKYGDPDFPDLSAT
jgi:hypothetical protein